MIQIFKIEFIGGPYDGHKELLGIAYPAGELAWIVCEDVFRLLAGKDRRKRRTITSAAIYELEVVDGLFHYWFLGATIASSFAHAFKGEPYFLTDARLHRGMSGSPVIVKSPDQQEGGEQIPRWRLLGFYSSSLDVSDRDPDQDERLALNTAWYASLIPEMLPSHCAVATGGRAT